MFKRWSSGVRWKSKNWLILKIQPRASVPSKRGISNLMEVFAKPGAGGGSGGVKPGGPRRVRSWLISLLMVVRS
jgi:hypothetical protein